ncbi:MAG: chemotaxis-specific protein-glutamate methyltransferase CheB [Bacteroidetes bacterium]|nr:MAG: chemotaxis-specific protein-glutamate methyltransferase CheB [Bacteroidota bacterium]
MEDDKKIRVIIIDGSSHNRNTITQELSKDPEIEVVGSAADTGSVQDMIQRLKPDVVTIDIETSQMDAIEFLRELMPNNPIPVVAVSYLTLKGKHITLQALESGAVEFVPKPIDTILRALDDFINDLSAKIKLAATANVSHWKGKQFGFIRRSPNLEPDKAVSIQNKVIIIGGSIGGVEGLRKIITRFPQNMPSVLVVQHMLPGYSKTLAYRLDEISAMNVKEAEIGDRVQPGLVLIAPGDFHMKIVRAGGKPEVSIESGERVNDQRPSIDVLMFSAAEYLGSNAIGVLLGGDTDDGALGLKAMKGAGAKTIAQDLQSCLFHGAINLANEYRAIDYQFDVDNIAQGIMDILLKK